MIIRYSFLKFTVPDNIIVFLNKLLKLSCMEKLGYILLIGFYVLIANFIISDIEVFYPDGFLLLLGSSGLFLLFCKVLKERLDNKEDSYYSKEIDK
tara:strand:+ start:387 stop:674 length:288 start_codon:yes stop_codon:yes gene_type:complete